MADAGDHLLPLEILDDGEGLGGGDDREPRLADVVPDEILFRALKSPEALVVDLDDREVGVECILSVYFRNFGVWGRAL
ncbi:hypothetical protein, partial [Methanoculleus sp.]|uniref:hypothetical protein n=1 Tax=Methanoculleus sp. TaxID=90427 RepID=UPI0025D7F6BD